MGKYSLVPFFRFHSQKPASKRRFLKCFLVTTVALTTIVDRQFKKTGPCVQYGPRGIIWIEPRPERQQFNSRWIWYRLKHMTWPLWPLRPFTVGFWWTKSFKPVAEKLSHIYKFLPKRPSLVRFQQTIFIWVQ